MAMTSAQAHGMLEVSQMNPSLIAQIVPAPLTFKVDRVIAELIGEGYIGDLITLDARIAFGSQFPACPVHWRQQREFSGNNIMTVGIFYEGFMRWWVRDRYRPLGKPSSNIARTRTARAKP